MDKRAIFPTNNPGAKERDTFFVNEDRKYLTKIAANYHPEVQKYISNAKPIGNLVQVLLTALGAYEFWGQNVNGDRFRKGPLSNPGADYGYKTFMTNANYFTHHVNKDPNLAKGKVLAAVWNDKSKRVELIVGIDPAKDPEAITEIDAGRPLSFSMGCRTPYDVCTICGNKAKNRSEYCDHARYMMNQIDPKSGELVGVDNPFPKFFDISRVLIPADKTAYMWTKIASAQNPFHGVPSAYIAEAVSSGNLMQKVAEYREEYGLNKKATSQKNASITKRILLQPQTAKIVDRAVPLVDEIGTRLAPKLPKEAVDKLASLPLDQVLSSYAVLGMEPTKEEFDRLVVRFILENKDKLPEKTAEVDELMASMISPESVNETVVEALLPLAPYRSVYKPFLIKRAMFIRDKLREGDPEVTKVAEEARDLVFGKPDHMKPPVTPTTIAGLVAIMYALASQHGSGGMGGLLGDFIKKNPFLALAIGAAAYKGLASLNKPSDVGVYDIDDPNREPYNVNWQSRFARLQARPVSVIKTAARKPVDKALMYKALGGPAALFAASRVAKAKREADPQNAGPVSKIIAEHPKDLYAGLILEHMTGKPISGRIAKALESSSRVIKHASIEDKQFLELLPDEDYAVVSDLVILNAVKEIADSFLGGN